MLSVKILAQPDDSTCGPTCLHAVYSFHENPISLSRVIKEIDYLEEGGTLAVMLGIHALKQNFDVSIFTYNLTIFDPTWFSSPTINLPEKLREQMKFKRNQKLRHASRAYLEFLSLGGKVKFQSLTQQLLETYFNKGVPILTGLSATYLYKCAREYEPTPGKICFDDVRGTPMGHFVVLSGKASNGNVVVADPYKENPVSRNHYYEVEPEDLLHAILLGMITYDANLLVIERK